MIKCFDSSGIKFATFAHSRHLCQAVIFLNSFRNLSVHCVTTRNDEQRRDSLRIVLIYRALPAWSLDVLPVFACVPSLSGFNSQCQPVYLCVNDHTL